MEISYISGPETLPLRHEVLRPNQPRELCIYPGDDSQTTFHLGLFHQKKLVCIGSFYLEAHPDFSQKTQYRLRGMATSPTSQGKGYGAKLLRFGIKELEKRKAELLWFNARVIAFPFYEKLGFDFFGPLFEISEIGPHKVMFKTFDSHSSS